MMKHTYNKVQTSTGHINWWPLPAYTLLLLLFNHAAIATTSANTLISEFDLPKEISAANSIIVDTSGNVWFAEKLGKNLTMFNPQTKLFEVYPLPNSWGNIGPSIITFSPQGDIWFSVRRWVESDIKTNILGKFSLSDHRYYRYTLPPRTIPEDLIVAADGLVWFLAPDENRLYKFKPESAELQHYNIPTPNAYARAISLDHKGNIWFAEANANQIASFDPVILKFNEYLIPTRFANPGEITVDKEGRIWFVELTANRIGVFYPEWQRFDEAILPTPRGMPSAIKADKHGNLWFLEYRGGKVGLFKPLEATFKEYNIPAFNSQPGALAIDHTRDILWFSETSTEVKKLGRLDIKAALLAKDQVSDSITNKFATDSSNSNYQALLLFLALLLIIAGSGYYWHSNKHANKNGVVMK
jgi:streptogramin lyase